MDAVLFAIKLEKLLVNDKIADLIKQVCLSCIISNVTNKTNEL